ncbi:TadE/TadG family type IV pilus assembly protein [Streptomyces sp. ODS28]|uniref:TadE/TadG family type IV pilus assembly protein n=1 Tax=Streptomyces sp. ODS28 TaxID=3136688 RepID=UPI0031E698C1
MGERGSATTEMVLVLPLALLLVLLLAQAAMWFHATHIAQATAAHALSAARVERGTAATGQREGQRVLQQLGRGPLRRPHLAVDRDAQRAEVRITGTASSVVPFLHLTVSARAAGPVEAFRVEDREGQ